MKKNIQKKDKFIAIAEGEEVVLSKNKPLPIVEPIKYNKKYLQASIVEEINIPSLSEEEKYLSFVDEKKRLLEHYKPFLQELYTKENNPNHVEELIEFDYRRETRNDQRNIKNIFEHKGKWQTIKLPFFFGPTGEFNDIYYKNIKLDKVDKTKDYLIRFEASDYETDVYINQRLVTRHTGFFAPFIVDATKYVHRGNNQVVIIVHNYFTTTGTGGVNSGGQRNFGKKIYAETHFGYDEPNRGWHHCPAGIGIYGKATFEIRNKARIDDVYVRPNIDNGTISGKIKITNTNNLHLKNTHFEISIEGRNFKADVIKDKKEGYSSLQYGENFFDYEYQIPNFKLWTPDTPYLYEITIKLLDENNNVLDIYHTHFGMRKFHMDENSAPRKGVYYFNNERIILNGCNEMGHLERCVLEKNDDQLIDDILIAKVANINFYRITQRPALSKVYDYFDMLGMFAQTDFPIFSFFTYEAVGESYKQVEEMEKLVRNHPSVIIDSFCNERIDPIERGISQYVMSSNELEDMFETYRRIVYSQNKDRVIKIHEGDYNPRQGTWGVSDFHLYTYWYSSHQIAGGLFNKGYLPGIKDGWMSSCGEYGVDGLDRYELMKKYCPKSWLPKKDNDPWTPKQIPMSQAWQAGSNFYPEQENIKDWIRESRAYQAIAIKKYVDNLRRRTDIVQSRAVHLLIDAWPCGWTKTLVDVDRIPKPAYYVFKECSIPVRVSLRSDRVTAYSGDIVEYDVFALNDTNRSENVHVVVSIYENGILNSSFSTESKINPTIQNYLGSVLYNPNRSFSGNVEVRAKMVADNGEVTYDTISLKVENRVQNSARTPLFLGNNLNGLKKLFGKDVNENVIFTDDKYYSIHKEELEQMAFNGKRIVLFVSDPVNVLNDRIGFWKHPIPGMVIASNWLQIEEGCPFVDGIGKLEFKDLYNSENSSLDLACWYKFYWNDAEPILYFQYDRGNPDYQFHKEKKFAVAEKHFGKGEIIVSTLSNVNGFAGFNKPFDQFIINLLEK